MKKKYLLLSFVTSLSILKLDASENFSRRNRQRDWIAKYAEDDEEAKVNLMNKISFTIASCFIDALCEEDTSDVEFAVSQAYNQSSDNIFLPLSENLEQYKDEYFKNCLLNVNLLNILIEGFNVLPSAELLFTYEHFIEEDKKISCEHSYDYLYEKQEFFNMLIQKYRFLMDKDYVNHLRRLITSCLAKKIIFL